MDLTWSSETRFEVDGVSFDLGILVRTDDDAFAIAKERDLLDRYLEVLPEFRGGEIFEIGIAGGGSAVLMQLLLHPNHLVAVDRVPFRVGPLDRFIHERGLDDVLRPHYGVDQSDGARLRSLLDAGGLPLDLVIDDASHLAGPTTASFEALFPHLRPGGLYIVEDWNWEHRWADEVAGLTGNDIPQAVLDHMASLIESDPGPGSRLLRLAQQLVLARASMSQVIGDVLFNPWWIAVRRGPAVLDPETFRLGDLARDHFGLLSR